jgi:predicted RNA-binding Zn ribbon-like protein
MPAAPERHPPFKLYGQPALDLVNSLDNRFHADGTLELLGDYADLLRFTVQTGRLEPHRARRLARSAPAAARRAVREARELREALAATLYARLDGNVVEPRQLRTLERQFRRAAAHRELNWQAATGRQAGDGAFAWDWGRFGTRPELPVWMLAQSAAALLTSAEMERVRACGAATCRWLFLDTSRNHTRRWCDMKVCGNRMKARRFQARHEA